MTRMRSLTRMLACAVLVCVCPPAAARAQSAADETERPSLRIGPLEVRPRLVFSNVGIDNNVFNERENPRSDFTLTAAPDVEVSINPGRLKLSALTGSELVYFRKYTSERSANRTFSGRAELDLTVLKPFASYTSTHTSARVGSEIDIRARHHPRTAAAGTRVTLASRTSLLLSVSRKWDEFNPDEFFRGESLATTLNSRMTSLEGAVSIALTPLTTLSLAAVHEDMRFDLSPLRDSKSIRIGPSLAFSPLGLLSGTASVGYRRFEGRDAALQNYSGLVAAGTLDLILGERFKLDTSFSRDVTYSYEATTPYYVLSGGRATLATLVARGFDVRVTAGRESMQYRALAGQPSPGGDTVNILGGGFGYRLAERVQFSLMTEYRTRQSTRDVNREYDNNRIFATLSWGARTR